MDQKAFLNLAMPFKNKVFRLAKRILVSEAEAEDATQETYLKLWTNKRQLISFKNVEAYAMTLTKNYCLDILKAKRSGNMRLSDDHNSKGMEDLSNNLDLKDKINYVHLFIDQLPEQQKIVMQLRDIEQYEFNEIEEIMEMNPTAVRANLSRARKTVREKLTKVYQFDQTTMI